MNNGKDEEVSRNQYTEFLYDKICFGQPINPDKPEDIAHAISLAIQLADKPVFLEGVSKRLALLGFPCASEEEMLTEIKRRYKEILGFSCPRTVQEWFRGTVPGNTNRRNLFDLCYALEMDFDETLVFFQKSYLTIPFNVKSKVDAVFMYALFHHKPYSVVIDMLEKAKGFVSVNSSCTSTLQIRSRILDIDDDEKFIAYLSEHCYDNKQQFQLARAIIKDEISIAQKTMLKYRMGRIQSSDRLGSLTIEALLGVRYQGLDKKNKVGKLPKRFTESLPNDVTLGKIINDKDASYELLRKTLMLLKFYNFYYEVVDTDPYAIGDNLMDFYDELNDVLVNCGFAPIYERHPFDCLLLYCANSEDPIDMLHALIQNERN